MNNVRAVLTAKQWNALRGIVADHAYNVCEICGGVGPAHPVECHEIWDYNDANFKEDDDADEEDDITPVSDVLKVRSENHPNIKFVITKGLGHRRIYRDNKVARLIVDFL